MGKSIITTIVLLAAGVAVAADAPRDPQQLLAEMLADGDRSEAAWVALRATGDEALRPMLMALSRSESPAARRFAMAALAELSEADAAELLAERAMSDPQRAVRLEAMARLIWMDGVNDEIIERALKSDEQEVRSMAADAMVRRGRGYLATDELRRLAEADNLAIACGARLNLVTLGHTEHLAAVERAVGDEKTPLAVLMRILAQIGEDRITAAGELALRVAESDRPEEVRIQAYQAAAKVLPGAASLLGESIAKPGATTLRLNLLGILADTDGAADVLAKLAEGQDIVGRLAAFEAARRGGGEPATKATLAAVAEGHPVALEYVLERAETDLEDGRPADFHTDAMVKVIDLASPRATQMQAEHYRAARAATVLTKLATPRARQELSRLLGERYSPRMRAVAAGLVRAENALACELARPLLDSTYDELATDAALILGRAGDPAARPLLERYATEPRHPAPLKAMACWYLLKISGRTNSAAEQLAEGVK